LKNFYLLGRAVGSSSSTRSGRPPISSRFRLVGARFVLVDAAGLGVRDFFWADEVHWRLEGEAKGVEDEGEVKLPGRLRFACGARPDGEDDEEEDEDDDGDEEKGEDLACLLTRSSKRSRRSDFRC